MKDCHWRPPEGAAIGSPLGQDRASTEVCRRGLEERLDAFEVIDLEPPPRAVDTDCVESYRRGRREGIRGRPPDSGVVYYRDRSVTSWRPSEGYPDGWHEIH